MTAGLNKLKLRLKNQNIKLFKTNGLDQQVMK
jgi:hypothetical protein